MLEAMVAKMSKLRTYSELISLPTFEERYKYLKLSGAVGIDTFGFDRYLNQYFYRTKEWRDIRNLVIIRDNGMDLGVDGYDIGGKIIIHHMNPITVEDIKNHSEDILNPEFLICVSHKTHQAIHYGDDEFLLYLKPIERQPNDTCPWR